MGLFQQWKKAKTERQIEPETGLEIDGSLEYPPEAKNNNFRRMIGFKYLNKYNPTFIPNYASSTKYNQNLSKDHNQVGAKDRNSKLLLKT